jgi:hypothetical protein
LIAIFRHLLGSFLRRCLSRLPSLFLDLWRDISITICGMRSLSKHSFFGIDDSHREVPDSVGLQVIPSQLLPVNPDGFDWHFTIT